MRCDLIIASHLEFSAFGSGRAVPLTGAVDLVKTSRPLATIFMHSLCNKRTAKIGCGLVAAVFLLQFYWVRELLLMEAVVTLGFVVVALIGAVYAVGCIAVLWLGKLGLGRGCAMRKVLALPLFSLGLASLVCAAQRGGMARSVAAPAMRAMPTVSAGAVPAVPAHGAAPAYGAPVHTRTHAGAPDAHAVTTYKTTGNPSQHQPSKSGCDGKFHDFCPYPTNLLPGISDNFAGGYPVPRLGFDYAHFFALHPNGGRFRLVDGEVLSYGGGGGSYMPVPYYTEATPQEEEERSECG